MALSKPPHGVVVGTNGESGPAVRSPGPGTDPHLLGAGHWGQRMRLAAAPRGCELEQLISMGEDAELRALSSLALSHLCGLEQVILHF